MSDTPDKKDTPSSEPTDAAEKKSPWFVTPMGDRKQDEERQKEQPDKIKLQPDEDKASTADRPQKSAPAATAPKPAPASATSASKPNPFAGGSTVTVDDDPATEVVSMPALVIDGVAAAVAIAFTVLILQDVLPFL